MRAIFLSFFSMHAHFIVLVSRYKTVKREDMYERFIGVGFLIYVPHFLLEPFAVRQFAVELPMGTSRWLQWDLIPMELMDLLLQNMDCRFGRPHLPSMDSLPVENTQSN